MVEQNTKIPENKSNKKRKWLIGGGIVALIAVIAVIGIFAQTGEWFKGALNVPVDNVLYVDGRVDPDSQPDGSKNYPYNTIENAYNEIQNRKSNQGITEGTIKVAQGTYNVGGTLLFDSPSDNFAINLLGGYDNNFSNRGYTSKIVGRIKLYKIDGEISGFTFNDPTTPADRLNIEIDSHNKVLAQNNIFIRNTVDIDGPVVFRKNTFRNALADHEYGNILRAKNGCTVEENFFYDSKSSGEAIINVRGPNVTIKNNLIIRTAEGTKHAIRVSNAYNANILNNTISDNNLSDAAIYIDSDSGAVKIDSDSVAVKNNLISHHVRYDPPTYYPPAVSTAIKVNLGSGVIIEGNGFQATLYDKALTTENNNVECDADFLTNRSARAEDYKLGAESTCIDAGVEVSDVDTDYFGTSRAQGSSYDIGFHEFEYFYGFTAPIHSTVDTSTLMALQEEDTEPDDEEIEIMETFPGKIVYTTSTSQDTAKYESDCKERGGTFNECGTICAPDADFCVRVCAFTCENIPYRDYVDDEDEEPDPDPAPADDDEADPDPAPADEPDRVVCGEWSDVKENDTEYNVWMYLCNQGIVKGHDDGSLRTEETLTRAELLALAFRASESENLYDVNTNAGNCFNDVQRQWFAPYVCTGKQLGFIEGYPGGVAKPGNVVILAEGLKMFMGALDLDPIIDSGDIWYGSMLYMAKSRNYLPYSFNHPGDIAGDRLTRRIAFNMLYRILYTLN